MEHAIVRGVQQGGSRWCIAAEIIIRIGQPLWKEKNDLSTMYPVTCTEMRIHHDSRKPRRKTNTIYLLGPSRRVDSSGDAKCQIRYGGNPKCRSVMLDWKDWQDLAIFCCQVCRSSHHALDANLSAESWS